MLVFVRSNNCNPDVRVSKYIRFAKKSGYSFAFWGWNRDGEEHTVEALRGVPTEILNVKAKYGSGFKNIFKLLIFSFWLFAKALLSCSNKKIFHLCDFDSAFPVYLAIRVRRIFGFHDQYVYDIFDFYIDAFPVPFFLRKPIIFLERFIVRDSVCVILPSAFRRQQLLNYNVSVENFAIIENANDLLVEQPIAPLKVNAHGDKRIHLGYVGILPYDRSLERLTEIVSANTDFKLTVIGFGPLEGFFRNFKAENIYFLGKLPHALAMKIIYDCDVIVALYDPLTKNHSFVAPNKLYESLQLSKPILVYKDSIGAFEVGDLHNVLAIDFPITALDREFFIERINLFDKERSSAFYSENFSEKVQYKRYLEILEGLVE